MRLALVDHGAGNLVSIGRGLESVGATISTATHPDQLAMADGIVLPGVGSAGATFDRLQAGDFVEALRDDTRPLLGICVGLQLLFDGSEEGAAGGLGLIPGSVERLSGTPRLPHIGWNDITITGNDPLFAGIDTGEVFYFVHSYAPVPTDSGSVLATTSYGREFAVAARSGRAVGVQFHPERSGAAGLRLLGNFAAECREARRAA
ncbi:imidazole glycerol phosphate synthase subunit HisH [bacterium]|nr:imidazole glycerol phosphate synthase subunit HisH [bacterium]